MYDIQVKDFALSADGVHLLRNRFNYKTINFDDINAAGFKRAVETKNVTLTLLAGSILIAFAVLQVIGVFNSVNDPKQSTIYIKSIGLLVLPFLLGCYCFYISIKKVPSLIIEVGNQKHTLSIKDLVKSEKLDQLEKYLKAKLGNRFSDASGYVA